MNCEEDKGDSNFKEKMQEKFHYSEIPPCHVPSKYQFEEDVSGDEDAVLNYAANKGDLPSPNCHLLNRPGTLPSQNETPTIHSTSLHISETPEYETPSSSTPSKISNISRENTHLSDTPKYQTPRPLLLKILTLLAKQNYHILPRMTSSMTVKQLPMSTVTVIVLHS